MNQKASLQAYQHADEMITDPMAITLKVLEKSVVYLKQGKQLYVAGYAPLYRRATELSIRLGQAFDDTFRWSERAKARAMLDAISRYDLAMAAAVLALVRKEVSRIILARPAVEAGEKLGFLPGDIYEKVNPYLRPLYDALFEMLSSEKALKLIDRGVIEIAPLAFMRGRTLNDSFVILDEAQNSTTEQMKMFLTRLGFDSKAVITGDITQIDLPVRSSSGLVEVLEILQGIEGISFVNFDEGDVVRHPLVQQVIRAYEKRGL